MNNNQARQNGDTDGSGRRKHVVSAPTGQKNKRHRVRYVVLGVFLVLLLLVVLLPYGASTGAGSRLVLSAVNASLSEQVTADDLSLRWFGPCRVKGLTVRDVQNREVLTLQTGSWSEGLWRGLSGPAHFQNVELEKPRAVIYATGAQPQDQSPPQKSDENAEPYALSDTVQQLRGTVRISGGAVKIVSTQGQAYDIDQFEGKLEFDTLNKVKGDFQARLGNEGTVLAQVDVSELLKEGRLDLVGAQGHAQLDVNNFDVAELASLMPEASPASGRVTLNATMQMKQGTLTADYQGQAQQLTVGQPEQHTLRPTDVQLKGQVTADDKQIQGSTALTGQPGQIEAQYHYTLGAAMALPGAQALTATALRGEKLEDMPTFDVQAQGQVDLAQLASAVPGLLKLQQDVEVTAGTLTFKQLTLRGGAAPAATATFELAGLRAQKQDKQLHYEPIVGDFQMEIQPEVGLHVQRGRLAAAFAEIQVSGTADQLTSQFNANLSLLQQQVSELVQLGEFELAGQLDGRLNVKRTESEQVGLGFLVTGKDFKYATAELAVEANPLQIEGDLILPSRESKKLTISSIRAQVADQMTATGSGWYAPDEQRGQGQLKLEGDLGRARGNIMALLGQQTAPAMSGQMLWNARCELTDAALSLSGGGRLDNVSVGTAPKQFTEQQVQIKHELHLDRHEKKLQVNNVSIQSQALTADVHGSVLECTQRAVLDLTGQYEAAWDKLTTLLHAVKPDTADDITLEGDSSGPFSVTGPLRQAGVEPPYRQLKANIPVSWSGGQVAGLSLGPAQISPSLQDATVSLGEATIPAQGGAVQLNNVNVDLTAPESVLKTGPSLVLLQNVQVDKKLGQQLLSRINPIFGHVAGIDGQLSLTVEGVALPLSKAILERGVGKGQLDLTNVHVTPTGFFGELLQLAGGGLNREQPVDISRANFRIEKGKIAYDNLLFTFSPQVQLNFSGSVGFDDKLNLVASMPIGRALLQRMGVSDAVANYILLAKPSVDVPIVGTRQVPQLKLQEVDLSGLVERASQQLLRDRAGGLLKDIFDTQKIQEPRQGQPPQPEQQPSPDQQPRQKKPPTVGGLIFDILRPGLDEQQQPPAQKPPKTPK